MPIDREAVRALATQLRRQIALAPLARAGASCRRHNADQSRCCEFAGWRIHTATPRIRRACPPSRSTNCSPPRPRATSTTRRISSGPQTQGVKLLPDPDDDEPIDPELAKTAVSQSRCVPSRCKRRCRRWPTRSCSTSTRELEDALAPGHVAHDDVDVDPAGGAGVGGVQGRQCEGVPEKDRANATAAIGHAETRPAQLREGLAMPTWTEQLLAAIIFHLLAAWRSIIRRRLLDERQELAVQRDDDALLPSLPIVAPTSR